jgi:hypothetical protein
MVGSIAINCVAHDALFLEAKRLIHVTGTVIGYEDVQKEPVCTVLAKCAVCYFGQKPSTQALIGNADHQALDFHRSMLRTEPLENREGSNLSFTM